MNELEKKMHGALSPWSRDDAARAAAKIALEEIKAAFKAGQDYGDGHNHYPDLDAFLKRKGYE